MLKVFIAFNFRLQFHLVFVSEKKKLFYNETSDLTSDQLEYTKDFIIGLEDIFSFEMKCRPTIWKE